MKLKICGTKIICSRNERTSKNSFVSMRKRATKIILKTCIRVFMKKINGEAIVVKRKKSVKNQGFIINAQFSGRSDTL